MHQNLSQKKKKNKNHQPCKEESARERGEQWATNNTQLYKKCSLQQKTMKQQKTLDNGKLLKRCMEAAG